MSAYVEFQDNTGKFGELSAKGFPHGTVLGQQPTVILVVHSDNSYEYQGHLELSPEGANILGEELRKAAEVATNKEDAYHGTGQG